MNTEQTSKNIFMLLLIFDADRIAQNLVSLKSDCLTATGTKVNVGC